MRKLFENKDTTVYEQSPCQRTICCRYRNYFLKFPYIIFICKKNGLFVFLSKKPIIDFKNEIYLNLLPNNNFNLENIEGEICLGNKHLYNHLDLINYFWSSEFYDLEVHAISLPTCCEYDNKHKIIFQKWLDNNNPMELEFLVVGTLEEVLKQIEFI